MYPKSYWNVAKIKICVYIAKFLFPIQVYRHTSEDYFSVLKVWVENEWFGDLSPSFLYSVQWRCLSEDCISLQTILHICNFPSHHFKTIWYNECFNSSDVVFNIASHLGGLQHIGICSWVTCKCYRPPLYQGFELLQMFVSIGIMSP